MKSFATTLSLLALAAPLAAQAPGHAGTGTMATVWRSMSGYVTQAAVDMPEAKYSYKPTPEVRSFEAALPSGPSASTGLVFIARDTGRVFHPL